MTSGGELTATIQKVEPGRRIVAFDDLILLVRLCVIRTSAPGERAFYTPLFFASGAMTARYGFVELAKGFFLNNRSLT